MVADVNAFVSINSLGYYGLSKMLWALGIESLLGPDWPSQRRSLCWVVGWWSDYCDMLYEIKIHDEVDNWDGTQEFNVKIAQHLMQNNIVDEFQEYAENFNWGLTDAPDYDLENITPEVPIRVIFAD